MPTATLEKIDPNIREFVTSKRRLLIDGNGLMPNPAEPFRFTIQPPEKCWTNAPPAKRMILILPSKPRDAPSNEDHGLA